MFNVFNGIMVQMRHYSFAGTGAGKPSRVEVVPVTTDEEDLFPVFELFWGLPEHVPNH